MGLPAGMLLLVLPLLLSACASAPPPSDSLPPAPSDSAVTETGYTIQLGAFSVLNNAARFTDTLRENGLDAYYFRHDSGLFKVRLGEFTSRGDARQEAARLYESGMVDHFWIVAPEDYALARSRTGGQDLLRDEIVKTAEGFIGLPYQWGGSSPQTGFDCSGLTMAVYQLNGINLPRSSREQFTAGKTVTKSRLARGDLVFFSLQAGRKISHVGIYRGDGSFIHAPGKGKTIRVDTLSNTYFRQRYTGGRTFIQY